MSRHTPLRLPRRSGLALRQFRADPWPGLLLALLVALIAFAATLWPRYVLDMNGRQVPYQVSALSPLQRDLLANWGATMVPQADREYTSVADSWGPVMAGLEGIRADQPEPLRSMLRPGQFYIELGKNNIAHRPPEGTEFAQVYLQQRIDPLLTEHVELVSGDWPEMVINASPQLPAEHIPEGTASGPVQVLLLQEAAQQLNLAPGDEFAGFLITGTYAPKDAQDLRWAHMANSISVGEQYSGDAGLSGFVTVYLPPANPGSTGPVINNAMKLFYPLDASGVRGDQVEQVTAQLIAMGSTQQNVRLPATPTETYQGRPVISQDNQYEWPIQATFSTESLSTFQGLSEQQRATASILAVVAAGPIGVALAVLALASRLIVSRRERALSLASSRGGSSGQLRRLMAAEGLVLGLPAALLGHYAAHLIDLPRSGWTEWVPVLLIGLAPAVLLAWTASTLGRSTRSDLSSRGASRLRVLLEVIVLALAALALWRLFDRGLTGVASGAGAANGAGPASATPGAGAEASASVDTGVDLLMAATPILLALAACVITLRLYPLPVHALMVLFRRGRGLTHFLGAARAVRDPAGGVLPALAVILGVSVAVLSSVLASSINHGAEMAVWRTAGADVRLSGPPWSPEDVEVIAAVDGVAQVAAIRAAANQADLTGSVEALGITTYIVDSTLPQVWADTPLPALPPELFTASGTTPVLTGGPLEETSGTASLAGVGDVQIVGHLDALPGVRTRGAFLVVDRSVWEALGESTPAGEVLLVKAENPAADQDLVASLNEAVPNALAETQQEKLATFADAPVTGSMTTLLVAVVVATTALTVLAVLLVQLMGASARTALFAVLRTLGLSQRQARTLTTWELGPLVAMAFVVGTALGVIVPWLLLQAINLTGLTGGSSQPALSLDPAILGPVLLGILVAAALAIAISAALAGRANLGGQLRRGEER